MLTNTINFHVWEKNGIKRVKISWHLWCLLYSQLYSYADYLQGQLESITLANNTVALLFL